MPFKYLFKNKHENYGREIVALPDSNISLNIELIQTFDN